MNFNQGDYVVHQNFGVGTVKSIEGMNLTGTEPRLFYRIDFLKSTIWVPVGHQPERGLRPVTPKKDLDQYRALLESIPIKLNEDFRKRQIELEKRLDRGTFQGLCEIVRDLYALKSAQSLNYYEQTLYNQAWASLVMEWSTSSGISPNEASREIEGYLQKGHLNPGPFWGNTIP
jgi:CarD family transcriptional regulator